MPTLQRDGAQIYFESYGEGPALVLAHGAGGNAAIWFNQIAHFSERFQCIAFDHRCFARSPVADGTITVEQFRDDLLAILDALEVESAHLVGQSMGGFTVLRCALDAPERVRSLTLSCTSGGIVNPNPTPSLRNLTASDNRGVGGIKATMAQKSLRNAPLMQLYESINNFNTEFTFDKLAHLLSPASVVQLDMLQGVQCPALIISGAEDPLFPSEQLATYVPHFADARIEIVEDAGHSPYFERPDVFNALLDAHINP